MDFLTKIFTSSPAKLLAHCAHMGLMQATGKTPRVAKANVRNLQCIKLTKEHGSVVNMVTYWSSLRINKLQQQGVQKEVISSIARHDARFLTTLAYAITTQAETDPDFDAWLFFHDDVQATDFFELQHCARGTRITKASFVIQMDC